MAFKLPEKREQLIVLAKLAEQCERYDEMLVAMKRAAKLHADLSSEERNLLSVAYKNVIGTRRACWRAIASLEQKEDQKRGGANATAAGGNANATANANANATGGAAGGAPGGAAGGASPQLPLIRAYKRQIEAELGEICSDVLALLDGFLIPNAPNDEAKVYYYKMKGDYHRYYAEIDNGEEQREKAHESYSKATEYSATLKATSPIRLGLALNFSVFYYEILKSPDKGCQLARQAFEEALNDPEVLDEEQHKEAALIMQLLRDNLALWTEDSHPEGADDGTKMEDME